jgi:hypothetical protein
MKRKDILNEIQTEDCDAKTLAQLKAHLRLTNFVDMILSERFPILVLIDIGGSLLYKTQDKIASAPQCDKLIRKSMYFYRPNIGYLLETLMKNPRVKIGFCSSITRKNILPVFVHMLSKYKIVSTTNVELLNFTNKERIMFFDIFGRDFTSEDPNGAEKYSTKRDLNKVWEST